MNPLSDFVSWSSTTIKTRTTGVSHRQRLGLSLKDVTEEERDRWTAEHGTILAIVPPGTGANLSSDVDSPDAVEVAQEEAIAE